MKQLFLVPKGELMWLTSLLVIAAAVIVWLLVARIRRAVEMARFRILEILRDTKPNGQFGLDIVMASKGAVARGSVYVYLEDLERKGYVHSWPQNSHVDPRAVRRRMYQITEAGLGYLAAP
ncbi:MAG: hypothetical protein JWN50_3 [Parcubacteria group bacterium]|nr:hypothetical protein [Parcubacteria group bacterium]